MNLTIEKLVYGGEGLARLPDGKAFFLPFVLPGEEVRATLGLQKSSYARATADEVIKPATTRVTPKCPYFAQCGGCHYQHTMYDAQLDIKRAILRETLQRNAKMEWKREIQTLSAEPWNYRNRTRMKIHSGAEFAMGYHRLASHDLLAVKSCPISSPLINRAVQVLWTMGEARDVPSGAKEIEFFSNHSDTQLLVELYQTPEAQGVSEFASALQKRLPEIKGVAIFAERAGGFGAPQHKATIGAGHMQYQVGEKAFRVSAGAFFQTNRYLVQKLAQTVAGDFFGKIAVDLYAGGGLFANYLAKRFEQVFAVESSPASASDLKFNALKNVVPIASTTEKFLPRCLNMNPEVVVVDPPRSGLGPKATQLLAALRVKRIVYVACDPATLARDVRTFLDFGYKAEEVFLVDLFPQTFHLESIVRLVRVEK